MDSKNDGLPERLVGTVREVDAALGRERDEANLQRDILVDLDKDGATRDKKRHDKKDAALLRDKERQAKLVHAEAARDTDREAQAAQGEVAKAEDRVKQQEAKARRGPACCLAREEYRTTSSIGGGDVSHVKEFVFLSWRRI